MHKILLFTLGLIAYTALTLSAQTAGDPVLFTVNQTPVYVSEFTGIYTKTNQDKADFSRQSLEEYLDLYVKFKIKVQKARDMRLDTLPALKGELDGYRQQVAASYLVDKELTDKLVSELYQRMRQDVDITQIFISCSRTAPAKDTLRAYNRAANLLRMVMAGSSIEQLAADSSDDKSAKETRGNIGYVTAMFPDGFYDLEKAVYSSPAGKVIPVVIRTSSGYHVVRVNNFRPARGEMEVAQILIRKGETPEKAQAAKMRADSVYQALMAGAAWEDLCAKVSEDKMTAGKGGYIGFFGINKYQKAFEDAAFALAKDKDFSMPVETSIGWHIIRRVSARPVGTFDLLKRGLSERVKKDSRSEIAKQSMVNRIQSENGFTENKSVLDAWTALQTDTIFHTYKWKPDANKPQTVLAGFGGGKPFTLADFEDYCMRVSRERMRGRGYPVPETVAKLYHTWKQEITMQYEESQLVKKYPEFKSLMREYEEGMLLFEAAKIEVWDRANTDSTGLEQYFNQSLKGKYMWDERARVSLYTLKTDDPKVLEQVRKLAAKKPAADVLKKFNKKTDLVNVIERVYEKGKAKDLENLWAASAMTTAKTDAGTKTATFSKIEAIIPPTAKALNEARGYAVADYQDYLEKKWVDKLRETYKVDVNRAVFESLIKK